VGVIARGAVRLQPVPGDRRPARRITFDVNGYRLQDEAFLSWFAHDNPSIGIKGLYSYLGTFTSPSTLC
jgi:hypothetical protein